MNSLQEQLLQAGLLKSEDDKLTTKQRRKQIKNKLTALSQIDKHAEQEYYFQQDKIIKKVYVSAEQQQAIEQGRLIVVVYNQRHYLIAAENINEFNEVDDIFIYKV